MEEAALQFATMVILTVLRGRRVVKASSSMLPRSVPPLVGERHYYGSDHDHDDVGDHNQDDVGDHDHDNGGDHDHDRGGDHDHERWW